MKTSDTVYCISIRNGKKWIGAFLIKNSFIDPFHPALANKQWNSKQTSTFKLFQCELISLSVANPQQHSTNRPSCLQFRDNSSLATLSWWNYVLICRHGHWGVLKWSDNYCLNALRWGEWHIHAYVQSVLAKQHLSCNQYHNWEG